MRLLVVVICMVALLGLMAYTNPGMEDYNDFIRKGLIEEGQKQGDDALGQVFGPLLSGVASTLIVNRTLRDDYVFFSLYEVRIGSERLKVLGLLKNFIILERPHLKARSSLPSSAAPWSMDQGAARGTAWWSDGAERDGAELVYADGRSRSAQIGMARVGEEVRGLGARFLTKTCRLVCQVLL